MRRAKPASVRPAAACFSDRAFLAAALAATFLTVLLGVGARTWIDRPFAGFFLLADRSVPAIGRTEWFGNAGTRVYDRTLIAIDGRAIVDSDELHRRVAAKPIGSPFTYTLTNGTTTDTVTIASRRFSVGDYWAVFGAYLVTGLLYLLLAILAAWALPGDRLGRTLLLVGGVGGLFMLSSADLYPPGTSLRVHALSAALLPAALVHFALVAGDVRGVFPRFALPIVWGIAVLAATSMQLLVGDPAATRAIHTTNAATIGLALGAAALGLVRARIRAGVAATPFLGCAALFGLGVPATIFFLAGVLGGVPQNASATLAFLFPLGVGIDLLRTQVMARLVDVARPARSL
jgi:hypothetical protein